jgi:hypothetical protein
MDLWDAYNSSEQEYRAEDGNKSAGDFVRRQIAEWQSALVRVISFTEANGAAGALVQIALALDELGSITAELDEENQKVIRARRRCMECRRRSERTIQSRGL